MAFKEYEVNESSRVDRVPVPEDTENGGQKVDKTAVERLDSQDRQPHLIKDGNDEVFPNGEVKDVLTNDESEVSSDKDSNA
jgi:hypothetical protein